MPTSNRESRQPSSPKGLGNQNVTRPAPIDENKTEAENQTEQERPGLENNNVTAPGHAKPPQT